MKQANKCVFICTHKNTLLFSHSVVSNSFETPWTAALQAPLSMGFPEQESWSGLPFLSPGDLPEAGIEPTSPALQADSLPLSHQEPSGCLYVYIKTYLNTNWFVLKGNTWDPVEWWIYLSHWHQTLGSLTPWNLVPFCHEWGGSGRWRGAGSRRYLWGSDLKSSPRGGAGGTQCWGELGEEGARCRRRVRWARLGGGEWPKMHLARRHQIRLGRWL